MVSEGVQLQLQAGEVRVILFPDHPLPAVATRAAHGGLIGPDLF